MQHLKAITIEEISKLADVSVGTVDRAIHSRGGISFKTKEKILKIAHQHGYRPNRVGRALARKEHITFGVITLLQKQNPYTVQLKTGIEQAHEEYRDFGMSLLIHSLEFLDPRKQAETIYQLIDRKVKGISIVPIDCAEVCTAVDEAVEQGIPVVTFNSDLKASRRLCFVGQDAYRSGQVAADLLCRFMGCKGKVFVMHGSHYVVSHQERLEGFRSVVQSEYPQVCIDVVAESQDDDTIAYEKATHVLSTRAGIDGIYIDAAGCGGVGKAVKELGIGKKVRIVCNDLIPDVIELIREDVFDATIFQDPITQGKLPIKILFDFVCDGITPERDFYPTKLEIYTKHLL